MRFQPRTEHEGQHQRGGGAALSFEEHREHAEKEALHGPGDTVRPHIGAHKAEEKDAGPEQPEGQTGKARPEACEAKAQHQQEKVAHEEAEDE